MANGYVNDLNRPHIHRNPFGPRPFGIMGGVFPPPPRDNPSTPAFCLFGESPPSPFGSSPAQSPGRLGGRRKNISEALGQLMRESQFTSTLEEPPLLWIVRRGWTKIALNLRDRVVGFGHELTSFLAEDRWSIIIGLVVTVLASLSAWVFSPKGENRTIWRSTLVLSFASCYIMWAITFLSQWHPLIAPERNDLRPGYE